MKEEPINMHEERWILSVSESGDVRLRDQKTAEIHEFRGSRALYDALGALADMRDQARWTRGDR